MADPFTTPRRKLQGQPSASPTPQHVRAWGEHYDLAPAAFHQQLTEVRERVKAIILEGADQNQAVARATVYILNQALHAGAEQAHIPSDIFGPPQNDDDTESSDSDEEGGAAYLGSNELLGGSNELLGGDDNSDNGTPDTEDPTTEDVQGAYVAHYQKLGWVDGSGSTFDQATIVGGRDTGKVDLVEVDRDMTPTVDAATVNAVIRRIAQKMSEKRWRAKKSLAYKWMRLHPWAINALVNLFIGNAIGKKCIERINALLAAAYRTNEHNHTRHDGVVAGRLANNELLSAKEREFYHTLEQVIRIGNPRTDMYSKFENNYFQCMLVANYNAIVQDCITYPAGRTAASINQVHGGQGRRWETQVLKACAKRMGWPDRRFKNTLNRSGALGTVVGRYGGGFLALVDDNVISILKKNAVSALKPFLSVLDQEFPEYKPFLHIVHRHLVRPLLSLDREVFNSVAKRRIQTRVIDDYNDIQSKIENIQSAPTKTAVVYDDDDDMEETGMYEMSEGDEPTEE